MVFPVEPRALALGADADGPLLAVDAGALRFVGRPGDVVRGTPIEPRSTVLVVATLARRRVIVAATSTAIEACAATLGAPTAPGQSTFTCSHLELGARILRHRRAIDRDHALVALATDEGRVRAFTTDGRAIVEVEVRDAPDGLGREVLATKLDGTHYAVAFRRGVPEDARGGVFLATEAATFTAAALEDVGMVEGLTLAPESVVLVASFEFGRPMRFAFTAEGELLEARTLHVAEGTREVVRAEVEAEPGIVRVRLRDGASDLVEERAFARASGNTPPVVTRAPSGFYVAFTEARPGGFSVRVEPVNVGPPSTRLP